MFNSQQKKNDMSTPPTVKRKRNSKRKRDYYWGRLSLELIVVFLGVTAGFLLNNWRTNVHDRSLETNYKTSFLSEVNGNIKVIEGAIKQDSLLLARAKPLNRMIQQEILCADSSETIIQIIAGFNNIILNSNTYENITNSGSFNLIKDFELRERIVRHYTDIKGISTLNEYLFAFYNDFTMPFIMNEISFNDNTFINPKILQSHKFSNNFTLHYTSINQRYNHYKNFLKESLDLKEKLKNSLSQ